MENQEDLAIILTAEQGKPLAEARANSLWGSEWFAEEARRAYGRLLRAIKRQTHYGSKAAHRCGGSYREFSKRDDYTKSRTCNCCWLCNGT